MRYHGFIGYSVDVETYPGVWEEEIVEHEYYGNVIKQRINVQGEKTINPKITISNNISIIANPYAYEHVEAIRYVTYLGKKWNVTDIEIQTPRIILTLGDIYNDVE